MSSVWFQGSDVDRASTPHRHQQISFSFNLIFIFHSCDRLIVTDWGSGWREIIQRKPLPHANKFHKRMVCGAELFNGFVKYNIFAKCMPRCINAFPRRIKSCNSSSITTTDFTPLSEPFFPQHPEDESSEEENSILLLVFLVLKVLELIQTHFVQV